MLQFCSFLKIPHWYFSRVFKLQVICLFNNFRISCFLGTPFSDCFCLAIVFFRKVHSDVVISIILTCSSYWLILLFFTSLSHYTNNVNGRIGRCQKSFLLQLRSLSRSFLLISVLFDRFSLCYVFVFFAYVHFFSGKKQLVGGTCPLAPSPHKV